MSDAREHDWALPRLTRFATGTLSEAEMLQMQAHLASCPDCEARLAPVRQSDRLESAHLPASLVATWSRSAGQLSALERDLVSRHLASCAQCRATLEFAGHAAALPVPVAAPLRRVRADLRWARGWAFGVSGVAAAAALWLFVVRPAIGPHDPRTSATMGGAARGVDAVTIEPATLGPSTSAGEAGVRVLPAAEAAAPVSLALFAQEIERGAVLELPAGLGNPATDGTGQAILIRLLAHGRELGQLTTTAGAIRLRSDRPLPPGTYELRLSHTAPKRAAPERAAPPRVWRYRLIVR